jgi:hypothetical protein
MNKLRIELEFNDVENIKYEVTLILLLKIPEINPEFKKGMCMAN